MLVRSCVFRVLKEKKNIQGLSEETVIKKNLHKTMSQLGGLAAQRSTVKGCQGCACKDKGAKVLAALHDLIMVHFNAYKVN